MFHWSNPLNQLNLPNFLAENTHMVKLKLISQVPLSKVKNISIDSSRNNSPLDLMAQLLLVLIVKMQLAPQIFTQLELVEE